MPPIFVQKAGSVLFCRLFNMGASVLPCQKLRLAFSVKDKLITDIENKREFHSNASKSVAKRALGIQN